MSNAGMKFDGGKPDLTLLEPLGGALSAVAEVLEFGAKKYARNSWQDVPDGQRRYKAAAMRHSLHALGDLDSESGLLHAAHQACSILFAIQIHLNNKAEKSKPPEEEGWDGWRVFETTETSSMPCLPEVYIEYKMRRSEAIFAAGAEELRWKFMNARPSSADIVAWRFYRG